MKTYFYRRQIFDPELWLEAILPTDMTEQDITALSQEAPLLFGSLVVDSESSLLAGFKPNPARLDIVQEFRESTFSSIPMTILCPPSVII